MKFMPMLVVGLLVFLYPNSAQAQDVKQRRLSAIVVEARTEAQKILRKLDNGADFSALARQYSIGPGSEEGGDIGYSAPGDLMRELETVAADLQVGQYSSIIEIGHRYFIIKKTDEGSGAGMEEASPKGTRWNALMQQAVQLYQEGRYAEAVPTARKGLELAEAAFGPDRPDVATSLNNLAALHKLQGQLAQAEPLYERSLAILEEALGPDHPDVATTLGDMAELYRKMDRAEEAEPLDARAARIRAMTR